MGKYSKMAAWLVMLVVSRKRQTSSTVNSSGQGLGDRRRVQRFAERLSWPAVSFSCSISRTSGPNRTCGIVNFQKKIVDQSRRAEPDGQRDQHVSLKVLQWFQVGVINHCHVIQPRSRRRLDACSDRIRQQGRVAPRQSRRATLPPAATEKAPSPVAVGSHQDTGCANSGPDRLAPRTVGQTTMRTGKLRSAVICWMMRVCWASF